VDQVPEDKTPGASPAEAAPQEDPRQMPLRDRVVKILKTCYDPEIPVDIYDLGLIYDLAVSDEGNVDIKMTLTSPACPVAGSLPPEVENKVKAVDGVKDVKVAVVWEPPWKMDMMTEAAKLKLGMM
jgi:FeS assembly SUF system protein